MTPFFPRMWDGIEACEPQGSGGGGLEGSQQALLSGELFSHGNGELARRCARKPVTQCQ